MRQEGVGKCSKKGVISGPNNIATFDKFAVDFIGPINPLGKRTDARYIITSTNYFTRWEEVAPVTDCTATMKTRFLFDNVVTRFGCPKILMRVQGSHFINHTIIVLTKEFQI